MSEGLKSWSAKRELVLESTMDDNDPPPNVREEVQRKNTILQALLVYVNTGGIKRVQKSVNLNCM